MEITRWLIDQHDLLRKHLTKLESLVSDASAMDEKAIRALLKEVLDILVEHELIEKTVVYPATQKLEKSGDYLIEQFQDDHVQLNGLIAQMREFLAGDDKALTQRDTVRRFSSFVRAHMSEEESYLYPTVEEHLTQELDASLMAEVRAVAKR